MKHDILKPVPKKELTEDERDRTIFIPRNDFAKPYHWTLNEDGYLSLKPGYTEHDSIRAEIADKLIKGGVPPQDITAAMIEGVVSKAESAAIFTALEASSGPQED